MSVNNDNGDAEHRMSITKGHGHGHSMVGSAFFSREYAKFVCALCSLTCFSLRIFFLFVSLLAQAHTTHSVWVSLHSYNNGI